MRRTSRVAIWLEALVVAAIAAPVVAQGQPTKPWPKEPDSYRGMRWEAPLAEIAKTVGTTCVCDYPGRVPNEACFLGDAESHAGKVPTTRTCISDFEVGSIQMKEVWHFVDDLLGGVSLSFEPDDYERLRAIFVERYGPPTQTSRQPFQTRGGARATNEALLWRGKRVTIRLRKFAESITDGDATLLTKGYLDRQRKAAEEEQREGVKAF